MRRRGTSHRLLSRSDVFGVGVEPLERDAVLAHEDHGRLVVARVRHGAVEAQRHREVTGGGTELLKEIHYRGF